VCGATDAEHPLFSTNLRLAFALQQLAWSNDLANREPTEMAREILNYFVRNPQAADSLEGVARWRLMDEVIRRKLDETEAALAWLVAQGYLTKSVAPVGTTTFSLNSQRIEDARQFLAASPERQKGPQ
jgi:hypothetical protein